jgi:hypothetical protein
VKIITLSNLRLKSSGYLMMDDKELSPKIWVPILAACALVPVMLFSEARRALPMITLFGMVALIVYLIKQRKNDKNFTHRFLRVLSLFGVVFVGALIAAATTPPPTPEELAAQQQAKQVEARRDYLLSKKDLTDSECAELHGSKGSEHDWFCEPIMSDEAWREFQANAARSHEYSQAAHDYSDALHDYVETYHRLPPEHVVIDPN